MHSIRTYDEFLTALDTLGFLPFSSNPIDFPNLSAMTEDGQWHTGLDTDPWQWKTRLVDERRGAFGKLLCGKPAFISREWYPVFLAARRGGVSFEETFDEGAMNRECQRVMALLEGGKPLAVHEIKMLGGFDRAGQTRFEAALATLQMGFFITVSGAARKTTLLGQPYGWPGLQYQAVEAWAWPDALEQAAALEPRQAAERLIKRVREIVPGAGERAARKFLGIEQR